MLESYFFTDEDSLRAVGISSQPKLVHEKDIENFETCDEVYLLKYATLNDCEPNEPLRPNTKTWHARHPKDYLKHLIAVGEDGIYRETKGGVSALRALSPIRAMEVSSQRQFLRSLINDMANALNVPLSPDFVGDCHPVTSCHGKGDRILRNI